MIAPSSIGEAVKSEPSDAAGRKVKHCSTLGNSVAVPQILEHRVTVWPGDSSSGSLSSTSLLTRAAGEGWQVLILPLPTSEPLLLTDNVFISQWVHRQPEYPPHEIQSSRWPPAINLSLPVKENMYALPRVEECRHVEAPWGKRPFLSHHWKPQRP